MNIISFDESPPVDDCPFSYIRDESLTHEPISIKKLIKRLFFQLLSGRPKRYKPDIPVNPHCVALATGGNLGGAILSIPLIQGVRDKWPDSHLVIISNRQHGLDIIRRAGLGDSFLLAPTEVGFLGMLQREPQSQVFKHEILRLRPDIYIGNHNMEIGYLLPLRSIPCLVGQGSTRERSMFESLYDYFITHESRQDNWLIGYWRLLEFLSIDTKISPSISASSERGRSIINER